MHIIKIKTWPFTFEQMFTLIYNISKKFKYNIFGDMTLVFDQVHLLKRMQQTVSKRGRTKNLITNGDSKNEERPVLFWEDTYFCEHPFLFRSQTAAFAPQRTELNLHWLWVRRRLQAELFPYVMPQLLMWCIFKVLKTNIMMNICSLWIK